MKVHEQIKTRLASEVQQARPVSPLRDDEPPAAGHVLETRLGSRLSVQDTSGLSPFLCAALLCLSVLLAASGPALGQVPESAVQSHLEGRITVDPTVDSTGNYRGFEVLVVALEEGGIDTLGYAVTGQAGTFETAVVAPARGVYPLLIRRRGQTLVRTDLVVAEGDSATLRAELPVRGRSLQIRSPENSAWTAYQNTKALHTQALVEVLQDTSQAPGALGARINQTAGILWGLRDAFPGTLGAKLAAAEAVTLLASWNDTLLVERARQIAPENPRFVEVARTARRAQARLEGQEAALALVRAFQERAVSEGQRAALQAEVVIAHMDSLQQEAALAAARRLEEQYPDQRWGAWAERAAYEIENLMPGMPAPAFTLTTLEGETVRLDDLRGRPVLLEFYAPADEVYQQQLPERNALARAEGATPLALISVSVEPDTLLNEAFMEGRDLPGMHVIASEGFQDELLQKYNVGALPTRVLIDAEGRIVNKYVGGAFGALREEALRLIGSDDPS